MATYAELTADQKDDIATYDTYIRGAASSLLAIRKTSDPDTWNQFAVDNVDAVKATLTVGEVVPNSTGLGGAKDLTIAEFDQLQSVLRQINDLFTNNKALLVKAVGVNS